MTYVTPSDLSALLYRMLAHAGFRGIEWGGVTRAMFDIETKRLPWSERSQWCAAQADQWMSAEREPWVSEDERGYRAAVAWTHAIAFRLLSGPPEDA